MTSAPRSGAPVLAVGGVARRGDELLLVRRRRAPAAGAWSVPGGRVEPGEPAAAAVVREVREETGLEVLVDRFLGWVERIGPAGEDHFVILDFAVAPLDPAAPLRAADDAAEAAWVPLADLARYHLVDGLLAFLGDTGCLEA